jgi:hypothetical protein
VSLPTGVELHWLGLIARGNLSVNRGGSARSVETVILAALASRRRLWIRYVCQATTCTNPALIGDTVYGTARRRSWTRDNDRLGEMISLGVLSGHSHFVLRIQVYAATSRSEGCLVRRVPRLSNPSKTTKAAASRSFTALRGPREGASAPRG